MLKDLAFVEEGFVVMLRRSKTDQEGAGLCKGIPRGSTWQPARFTR